MPAGAHPPTPIDERPTVQPVRVALFTDTLAEVNGVARFIATIARLSRSVPGAELHVLTSTRRPYTGAPNIHNLPARAACTLPGYPELDAAWPDARAAGRLLDALRPHAVHVSTPGPVGLLGRRLALARGLPLLGTHHTDFPAYVDRLFEDRALAWLSGAALRWFYRPFDVLFARSDAGATGARRLTRASTHVAVIPPGIDTRTFSPGWRTQEPEFWGALPGVRPRAVKALYVGRVSPEKGLAALPRLWPSVALGCARAGVDAQLLVVGDGPYRAELERLLPRGSAVMLGFRHAETLSRLYASCDLFLFPSTTDTLGQTVMEAQASGLPAIVTDQGGPAGTVADGVTGRVLPPPERAGAGERWIGAAVRLLTDPALRAAMSAAAHAAMAPRTIERSFDAFWRVHAEAVGAHARGG